MSHLATIKTEIKDIEAVRRLCKEKGWTFHENKKTFHGMGWDKACDHAISFPGNRYELGLTASDKGYSLGFDAFLAQPFQWGGSDKAAINVLGDNCGTFLQGYAVHKATIEAERMGYLVERRTLASGAVQVVVSGM
jgi:hypothetical protein